MRRILAWSIPLALIVFGLLWPLVFRGGSEASDISDPVVFSNYKADFVVSADGRLDAVETITGEFPSSRHGIFRYWDVANQNSPRVRQKPEITSVLLDGEIVPYQLLWEDGQRFRVAKIGDPDRYLTYGTHVFEIRYTIPGVLDPGSTGANKQFAESTGDPELDVRVLLERHRAGLEQQNRTRRHLCHAARRGHRGAMLGRLRRRPGVPGSGRHGDHGEVGGPGPAPTHPGHPARRRRRAHPAAGEPAVALHLGPDPGTVGDRRALGRRVDAGGRADRVPLVSHHRRTVAGISAAVRAAGRTRTGADGVHPHRKRSKEQPHRDALLSRRTPNDRAETGQRRAVERPWAGRHLRMGPGGSGEPQGRYRAQGEPARHRVRGEEDRQVRRETQQGQDGYGQGGAEMGIRRRPDGQAQEGTVGAHRQCDRIGSCGVRICPLWFPVHYVGPAIRGVLPALRAVVDRRRRHPAYRGRT